MNPAPRRSRMCPPLLHAASPQRSNRSAPSPLGDVPGRALPRYRQDQKRPALMNIRNSAVLALVAIVTTACSAEGARPSSGTRLPADAPQLSAVFEQEHAQWVRAREDELRKPDGWPSLIGLHWVEEGVHSVGGGADSGIRLAIAPPRLGQVTRRGDTLYFTPAATAVVTVDGQRLQGETPLQVEGRDGGKQLAYDGGKGRITAIGRGGLLALRVRHAEAPGRLAFAGLDVFPADPAWRLQARFVAHPPGRTLPIVNLIGNVNASPNPGYVEFERDGRRWRLEALGDPRKSLNLMFQDGTSGRQSYAVGRYLQTGPVAADGTVIVDFNRAYNPPCAYTAYATCPLPPPENRLAQHDDRGALLRLAVLAGEKKYAAAPH